jgi:hypothetical protein
VRLIGDYITVGAPTLQVTSGFGSSGAKRYAVTRGPTVSAVPLGGGRGFGSGLDERVS